MIASKVAAKYMVLAGLFEAPPKIVKDVTSIVLSEFAKEYILEVEDLILEKRNFLDRMKESNDLEMFKQEVDGFLRIWGQEFARGDSDFTDFTFSLQLPTQRPDWNRQFEIRVRATSTGFQTETTYEAIRDRWVSKDKSEVPPDRLLRHIEKEAKRVLDLVEAIDTTERVKKEVSDLTGALREAKRYLVAEETPAKIKLDFTGWKYLDPKKMKEYDTELRRQGMGHITVITRKAEGKWKGVWQRKYLQILISLPDLMFPGIKWFRKGVQDLRDTCEHEVMHLGQDYLPVLKGVESKTFGLPSKVQPSTMNTSLLSGDDYYMNEAEYYPWLKNEISQFKQYRKDLEQRDWRGAAAQWVGSRRGDLTSTFFDTLKRNQSDLWRKAVKDFMREALKP